MQKDYKLQKSKTTKEVLSMESERSSFILISVVAIVAIVALVVMVRTPIGTSDLTGQPTTAESMSAAVDKMIDASTKAGHMIYVCRIDPKTNEQTCQRGAIQKSTDMIGQPILVVTIPKKLDPTLQSKSDPDPKWYDKFDNT